MSEFWYGIKGLVVATVVVFVFTGLLAWGCSELYSLTTCETMVPGELGGCLHKQHYVAVEGHVALCKCKEAR